jgi:putative solute:sodium symporter small subunit
MKENPTLITQQIRAVYWRRVRRLTLQLLAVWFLLTFGTIFFARELSTFTVFGWPFSFYMIAQGAVLIYVLIVALYAWCMQRLDKVLMSDRTHGE